MRKFKKDSRNKFFGSRDSNRSGRFDRRDSDDLTGSESRRRFGMREFSRSAPSDRHNRRDFDRPGRSRPGLDVYEVTCDKCGRETTVPFKPTGSKPVYCRECFGKNDNTEYRERDDSSFKRNKSFQSESRNTDNQTSRELAKINAKLDKIMKALNINE